MRIICLVPSLTELLHYLGLENEVVGITKFCVHPAQWFKNKTRVGGTKNCNHSAIDTLNPTLIIANKEENTKEDVESLQAKYTVYLSDIKTLQDAYASIIAIGELTNKAASALGLVTTLRSAFDGLQNANYPIKSCLYLIWQAPYMCAGSNTFINEILKISSLQNIVRKDRYPILSDNEIIELNPEVILLSSEPYPFKEKHILALQKMLPLAKVLLVDGEVFSWYGSRLLQTGNYIKDLQLRLS
jgi:ABC-type Fe3+-hydroxamate transport system substrate-binding protein